MNKFKKYRLDKTITNVSQAEQEEQDLEYWSKKSSAGKLDACFFLLEQYLDLHPELPRRLVKVARLVDGRTNQILKVYGSQDSPQ